MSQRAYMLAIRDHLQNIFGVDRDSCDVGFDGQPKPIAGETYIAVHPGSWRGEHGDYDLDEQFTVHVTVSKRLGAVPQDRWGTDVLDQAVDGLEVTLRQINLAIHKSYFVMNMANSVYLAISALPAPFGLFFEPLIFQDGGKPELKGPDWFIASDVASDFGQTWAHSGVAQTLTYGGARRAQKVFFAVSIAPPVQPYTNPITTPYALPAAQVGVSYSSQTLTPSGGRQDIADSYTFALAPVTVWPNGLPNGLSLSSGGQISGTPQAGSGSATPYVFRVSATDPTGLVGYQVYSITVNS